MLVHTIAFSGNNVNCRSSNEIKRSETLDSSIDNKTEPCKRRLSQLSVKRLVAGRGAGKAQDCQTEEFRLWCANCDAKAGLNLSTIN